MAGKAPKNNSKDAPSENYARGLKSIEIPQLGEAKRGKVRDSWIIGDKRVMVTTDRTSAYDRAICTVPGKGAVLNKLSEFWFQETADIIPNHVISVPHPNVLVARQAKRTLPVELVLRRYMAKSSSPTSVFSQYKEGKRIIYGIKFPDELVPNQEFPMGTIVTPTTKAEYGKRDLPLTDAEAKKIVDSENGKGTWKKVVKAALQIFERGRERAAKAGLILVDTKYEFGIDLDDKLMLIDEVHTPDSSRYWLSDTYQKRFKSGETPDTFDKEILRRWLSENGFEGNGDVPKVDPKVIDQMSEAYKVPYKKLAGKKLKESPVDSKTIIDSIANYI